MLKSISSNQAGGFLFLSILPKLPQFFIASKLQLVQEQIEKKYSSKT